MGASWIVRCRTWLSRWLGSAGGLASEPIDPDVREVFLGELDEVSASLVELLPAWRTRRGDAETLQRIRRGFHTLKGSGQMVGARTLGGFCGQVEQLALCLIEKRSKASPEMIAIIDEAIALLPACSRAMHAGGRLPGELRGLAQRAQAALGRG